MKVKRDTQETQSGASLITEAGLRLACLLRMPGSYPHHHHETQSQSYTSRCEARRDIYSLGSRTHSTRKTSCHIISPYHCNRIRVSKHDRELKNQNRKRLTFFTCLLNTCCVPGTLHTASQLIFKIILLSMQRREK